MRGVLFACVGEIIRRSRKKTREPALLLKIIVRNRKNYKAGGERVAWQKGMTI